MAGITVSGIGSGLDIAGIVEKLVAAERAPEAARIQRSQSDTRLKLSALGTVGGAVSGLQSALAALRNADSFGARTAVSSDEDIFVATAAAGAQAGAYDIETLALASAHKLASAPLASGVGLGAGTLHVTMGTAAFDVVVNAGSDTPAGIRDAFNAAATAAGAKVVAGLVNGDAGSSLIFTAGDSGAANAIRLVRSAGPASLDALVYDPGTLESLTVRTPAADAQVRIDGVLKSAAGNRISDAVAGITLDLKQADAGNVHVLTVASDLSASEKTVSNFVAAWNTVVDAVDRVTAFGGSGGTSGALIGDSMMRNVLGQLRGVVGGRIGELSGLGINTRADGKLSLDAGKLRTALTAGAATTNALTGLGDELKSLVDKYAGTDGLIGARTAALNQRMRDLDKRTSALDIRMESVEARYVRQFSALDTLIGQMNSTSTWLSQQLSGTTT
ncbi:MAG: flagellar filament capping protein FliD [Pseudomonadota bacterium]